MNLNGILLGSEDPQRLTAYYTRRPQPVNLAVRPHHAATARKRMGRTDDASGAAWASEGGRGT